MPKPRTHTVRRALAPLALAGALALTGCGSSTSPSSSGGGASSSSPSAAGAKVGDKVSLATLGAQSNAAMKAAKTGHAAADMGAQGSMEMDIDYSTNNLSMSIKTADGVIQMMKIGQTIYMGGIPDLPAGIKYVKLTGDGNDPMSGMLKPLMESMGQLSDPAAMLSAVEGVEAKVVAVEAGSTTYEVSLNAAQVAEMAKKALEKVTPSGSPLPTPTSATGTMTLTQTMDAKGLPLKVVMVTEEGGKTQTMTMIYSKWGEPVAIAEPPAAEVTTFAELLKG